MYETTGKVEDKEPVVNFPAYNVKKINEKVVSSRENTESFGNLRNLDAFDLSSSFLNEEKLPDANTEKELGNEYFKQKKFLEAIECYSRSIAFSPTSVAFANRAMAYLKVKKFLEAENDCTDALCLDDRYVKAYSRRLTARKELGKLEEAMEDADFAVRLEPNNPEIRKQFGEIKAMLEREFRGFSKDLYDWDSLHKDSSNKSKGRAQNVTKSTTGKVEDMEPVVNFPAYNVKKINEKVVSSRENTESFGNLRNSDAFDLSSSFLNEEKLPDANTEKELGNEYFKQKKFLEAIECYSRSIAFSPTSVAFANRAMAYLKVKKFLEAENDCTDALCLDDRYVKAYSRRLTARKELGKLEEAMEDADFAVRLEPNNPEIRKQYGEIKAMLERKLIQNVSEKKKSSAASKDSLAKGIYSVTSKAQTAEACAAKIMDCKVNTSINRMISLESSDKRSFITESNNDSRSVNEPGEVVASKLNTSIAKEPSGGNHKHELRTSMQDLASRAASRVMATAPKIITTPTSAYQFEVLWRSLSNDSAKQAELLKTIPPSDLPKIFKNALSAHILIDLIRCVATFFRANTSLAVSVINNLTNVPRFDLTIMCLSAMDRAELLRLWEEVFLSHQIQGDLKQMLVRLRPKYCYGEWESHILTSQEMAERRTFSYANA